MDRGGLGPEELRVDDACYARRRAADSARQPASRSARQARAARQQVHDLSPARIEGGQLLEGPVEREQVDGIGVIVGRVEIDPGPAEICSNGALHSARLRSGY